MNEPRTTLFENPWVNVGQVPADTPSGTHLSIRSGTGHGVLIIPVIDRDRYVLVTQPRPAAGMSSSIEFPRGGAAESSVEEALRELVEETGLYPLQRPVRLHPLRQPVRLGTLRPDTGLLSTEVGVHLVDVDPAGLAIDHVEDEERVRRLPPVSRTEIDYLVRRGRITCSMTLAALALLDAHIR